MSRPPYLRLDETVAYLYRAALYCPACMGRIASTHSTLVGFIGPDGLRPASVEDHLDRWAAQDDIDRSDERTFDSDEFPKVVLRADLLAFTGAICDTCNEEIS